MLSENKSNKCSKKRILLCVGIFIFCVLAISIPLGIWIYEESFIYEVCQVEAGTAVEAADFIKNSDTEARLADGSTVISTDQPGEFTIKIKYGHFTHTAKLVVEDTVPPTAEARNVEILFGETCTPEDFVTDITDATTVTVQYVDEPDLDQYGTQQVEICLTDAGENSLFVSAELYISPVNREVTVEAGSEAVDIEDIAVSGVEVSDTFGMDLIDYSGTGDYTVSLDIDGAEYSSIIHVVDTVAPVVTTCDVEGYPIFNRKAEDFIVEIDDATEVSVEFSGEPDLLKVGTQELTLVFTDEGGNVTEAVVTLTNLEDTEPPVISGAKDITVYIGDGVAYMDGVSVTDNSGDDISLAVDNSGVNLNEVGSYQVVYSAVDASGNETSETVTVTVEYEPYSEEAVYRLANQVLDEILTDDMTDYEKVYAIYYYTYHHISYVGTSEKGDWLRAAYEGITQGKGDCWTYASTAQALFNCAGIKNMMISKIPTATSSHTWTLVDIGDGWYHVDCTPRKDHPTIFMWTDAQLMEYSESHNLSHNYDHSEYPETN